MIVASFSIWYVQEQRHYEYLNEVQKRHFARTNPGLLCTASGRDKLGEWICPRKSVNNTIPGRCSYHKHRLTAVNNDWLAARLRAEDARIDSSNSPPPEVQPCQCGERKGDCACKPAVSKSLKRAEKYYLRNQRRKRSKHLKALVPNARSGKWSKAEDRVVMQEGLSLKELAVILQRSYAGVVSRRAKLRQLDIELKGQEGQISEPTRSC